VIVPIGSTLHVDACGQAAERVEPGVPLPARPRLRSGWARKRLAADEGERRVVLENLRTGRFLQFSADEARLLDLLDGRLTVPELVRAVAAGQGEPGVRRLLEVLAELSELGMLAGGQDEPEPRPTGWRRLVQPREFAIAAAPGFVAWLYRAGGRHVFSRAARALIAATIVLGSFAFTAVVARGGVRPFHVGGAVLLGSLAFIGGRLAVVTAHELAHALTLTSFGRRPRRIGVKLILVFPYAFVDTSEAWYEPRRRRIAVSAAGPITDALLAGVCALVALAATGIARDIAFQLALGAYLGALLNLNPMLDRDGYHVLADLLREPNLRRRGREYVAVRLARRPGGDCPRPVRVYGLMALAWAVVTALFAGAVALRFAGRSIGDPRLAFAVGVLAAALALVPTVLVLVRPLRARRGRSVDARESRSSLGGALIAGAIDGLRQRAASQFVHATPHTGHVEALAHATAYPGDDAPPKRIAAWMADAAERRGLPRELPVMAALVESGLKNLDHGDAASLGYFQMQTTVWLKDYPGYPDDPGLQLKWFIDRALAVKAAQPALAADPSRWGEWVAEVEYPREDLRFKYGERLEEARALVRSSTPEPAAGGATGAQRAVTSAKRSPPVITGGHTAAPNGYVDRLKAEAERIDDAEVPYLWGGGHVERLHHSDPVTPLDCSGAVSRVLGIDPRVAQAFETWGEPGHGKRVTIYANAGHVLMEIDGHFWGTSSANPGGGAGWIPRERVPDSYLARFTARHPPGA
jgi:putative peptide zinc metalloprotease protein